MQELQLDTRLQQAPGFAYITIPGDLLDNPRESVWVKLIIDGAPYTARTIPQEDGTHNVQFNRESLINFGLKPSQKVTLTIQRLEVAPLLNDMSADFLSALKEHNLEEDFKRLPAVTQRKYYEKVEKAQPQQRADAIREVVSQIQSVEDDLPRGDSL